MIGFVWPFAFLLLPLPVLLHRFFPMAPRGTGAIPMPEAIATALTPMTGRQGRSSGFIWTLLFWCAWISLVAAIARPYWQGGAEIRSVSGRSLFLAIDLSGSMEKRDLTLDGTPVDRLSAVKSVATRFIDERTGDRIGLVLYGDEAFVASPLTFDREAVKAAIAEAAIGMAGRTTAIGDALGLAIVRLRDDPGRGKAIILLSDGTNNAGSAEPEDAARLARDLGIRIHTIGLGSDGPRTEGSVIDPSADLDLETLQAVAEVSGGTFFRAASWADLQSVYDTISALEAGETSAPPLIETRDLGAWPAFVLLMALAALGFPIWRGRSS